MQTCPLLGIISKKICPRQIEKETLTIFYKLLHDSLFALTIFFLLTLIAEGILPGIIISHIGFSKLVFLLLGNIVLLNVLAKKITLEKSVRGFEIKNKNIVVITIFFSVIGALLVINSQLGINVFLNVFILLVVGFIGYLSYRILFHGE